VSVHERCCPPRFAARRRECQAPLRSPTPALPAHPPPQGSLAATQGGPFAILNGGTAQDVLVVALPKDVAIEPPLYVLHLTSGGCCTSRGYPLARGALSAKKASQRAAAN